LGTPVVEFTSSTLGATITAQEVECGLSNGALAGIVVGSCVAGIAVALALVFLMLRYRDKLTSIAKEEIVRKEMEDLAKMKVQ
jgi:hypothetical protein